VLADTLAAGGYDIVSGGTDTHLLLVDLRSKGLTGKLAEAALEAAGMTCNKNGVPFDTEKPTITSGIRLGSPAGTSRGFGADEFRQIGQWIIRVLDHLSLDPANPAANERTAATVSNEVTALCRNFPIYPDQG
jgi:glycine hydroxymethyltransferase